MHTFDWLINKPLVGEANIPPVWEKGSLLLNNPQGKIKYTRASKRQRRTESSVRNSPTNKNWVHKERTEQDDEGILL